jgi:predicted nucleic acid-binding protein
VIDANILVAELLRERGQALVASPMLEIYVAEQAWSESQHEIRRRAALIEQQGRIAPGTGARLAAAAIAASVAHIRQLPVDAYAGRETEARRRIPRDSGDWPTVAAALALDAAIWTRDNDFLGCGVPTWTSETLASYLQSRTG